jgi:3-oxoacyl-[acyl-carrier-protein] synthase II
MIASITGVGWVGAETMGWGRRYEKNPSGPSVLPKVTSRMIFGKGLSHFGRLDTYSKIGIAAIAFALKDAQRFEWQEKRNIGVIASTTCGCLERDIEYIESMLPGGGRLASPSLFACTLPNVFLGQAAINLGLTGPCYCVNEDELSGLNGLRMALNNILLDECPAVIAGLCDAGTPASCAGLEKVVPGAIFVVLEQSPADRFLSYGDMEMDEKGNITFNGKTVINMWKLLEQCLEGQKLRGHKTRRNTISVTGVGWVDKESMGWGRRHEKNPFREGAVLPKVTSRMIFGKGLPHFGRLDTYSKIGIAAIAFALKDAQQYEWREKRPMGVFASTTNGCLETDINYLETMFLHGGRLASPSLFAYVLPNIFLGEAAIRFGFTGPCYCVNEDELTGLNGLHMALNNLLLDESPAVIAGLCDAGRPEALKGLEDVTPGAIFFVLEQSPADKSLSYGDIEMDDKSNILFNGKLMTHMRELLHMCLCAQTVQGTQTNFSTAQ